MRSGLTASRLVSILLVLLIASCRFSQPIPKVPLSYYTQLKPGMDSIMNYVSVSKAVDYLDSLKSEQYFNTDLGLYFYYFSISGMNYFNNLNYSKSNVYADSAIQMIEPYAQLYPGEYAKILRIKGDILIKLKRFDEAIAIYLKSKTFLTEHVEICDYVDFDADIANLLYHQGRYENAIYFYKETLKKRFLCEKDSSLLFAGNLGTLNNIALSFEKLGLLDSALTYYQKALIPERIIQLNSDDQKKLYTGFNAIVFGNMGYIFFKLVKYREAESLFKKSIEINKDPSGNYFDALLTEIKLAELFIKQKRFSEAEDIIHSLKQVDQIQEPEKFYLRLKRVEWLLLDEIEQEHSPAYLAYRAYNSYQDSLEMVSSQWVKFDINSNLQLKQQLNELSKLEEKQRFSTIVLGSIILISILLIIILIQIFRQSRLRKESLQHLEEFHTKLNESHNKLEMSHVNKLKLVRVVAHDLRNPISGIVGFAELLKDEENLETIYSYADIIHTTGYRALSLIENMLKDKEFKLELETQIISIDEVIHESILLCQFQANQYGQKMAQNVESFQLPADKNKLIRVLVNLITNAIKFNKEKGTIEIRAWKDDLFGFVSVRDQGIGIPASMLPKLFVSDSTKMRKGNHNEESNGLGLVICKTIIEEHKGEIWAESEEGKGTLFIIRFPTE